MQPNASIQIVDIEAELSKLWEAQKEQNKVKACLFNLVLFSQDQRRTHYFKELIRSMIEKFPCRILMVEGDETSPGDLLEIQVSNQIVSQAPCLIACDQVNINVSRSQYARVPFLVIPHLIPDLPIYLLWGQDPTTDEVILPRLLPYATRLIFDSECTHNLQLFSQKLEKELAKAVDCEVMDMNWARLSGWRDAISHTFDPSYRLEHLQHVFQVVIRYQSEPTAFFQHCETQALYLTAWLAAQLGWKFHSIGIQEGFKELQFKKQDQPVKVILQPEKRPTLDTGSILGLTFIADQKVIYEMERNETERKVKIHITLGDVCESPFSLSLPNLQRGHTFLKEMFYRNSGQQYRKTLHALSEIPCQKCC